MSCGKHLGYNSCFYFYFFFSLTQWCSGKYCHITADSPGFVPLLNQEFLAVRSLHVFPMWVSSRYFGFLLQSKYMVNLA